MVTSTQSWYSNQPRRFRTERANSLELRVTQLERYLAIQHEITQIIAQSPRLDQSLSSILQVICINMGWDFGEVWHADHQDHSLICVATWHIPDSAFSRFEQSCHDTSFEYGKGLPGQVWANGKPAWMANVMTDANFMRTLVARQDGLHTGFGIPIRTEGEVIGAMTFFTRQRRPVDHDLVSILETVGSQIGLFIQRKRTEQMEYDRACALAMQEERQRLARDLHDSVTQTLFSASLVAEMLPIIHAEESAKITPHLNELHQLTRSALTEMRALLVELRPSALVDSDMTDLLRNLVQVFQSRTGIHVNLHVQITHRFSTDDQIALYRMTQEALNNIWKHAHASNVTIEMVNHVHNFHVTIIDDGRGFQQTDIPAHHFGLQTMRERAEDIGAIFEVESGIGCGTRISIVR